MADIHALAQKLPADHSAIIVLFENVWERRFREVVREHGGVVIGQRFSGPEALEEALRAIG